MNLLRKNILPIGLDIGHDSVKMLQLHVSGESLTVRGAGKRVLERHPVNDTGELLPRQAVDAIRDLLASGSFQGKRVAVALPRRIVQVKNLRLPMMPLTELAGVVEFESRTLFGEVPAVHVDFLPAGEVRQGADVRQEVLVFAAGQAEIDSYVEQLHLAGVVVDSLDLEACALYRSIERFIRRREDDQEVHVLIDVGMHRSQVLIGKGRDISFFKAIEFGGANLNDAVSRKLGISFDEARALRRRLNANMVEAASPDPVRQAVVDATRSTMEELAREVSLCMRYYSVTFRGQRPSKVKVVGGEAGDAQLQSILTSVLPVPVEAARPLFSIGFSGVKGIDRDCSCEWALALGLALRRAAGKFAQLDGPPRSVQSAVSAAEVVDLNAAIGPMAIPAPSSSEQEHFAAVRRAAREAAHA